MKCCLDVTLFLAENNLPFRGSESNVYIRPWQRIISEETAEYKYNADVKAHMESVKQHQ